MVRLASISREKMIETMQYLQLKRAAQKISSHIKR